MMKCDPIVRAQCPHGAYCEAFAVYADESECAKFNQAVLQKAITCDAMNPKNSIFQRTRHACPMYEFDRTKVCECGETIEDWYNFCPTCGLTIKRRRKR